MIRQGLVSHMIRVYHIFMQGLVSHMIRVYYIVIGPHVTRCFREPRARRVELDGAGWLAGREVATGYSAESILHISDAHVYGRGDLSYHV